MATASTSLFSGNKATGLDTLASSRQGRTSKPAPVDLLALQNASRVLYDQFAKDSQIIPDLGNTLTTSAGHPSANYSVFRDDTRAPFQKRKFIKIPDGLIQYYESGNVTTRMGLLPEIDRVWISIDHKLFLWEYGDEQGLSSFTNQPDTISHVAVVKPKPDLFIPLITHLLVICTPVTVILLGLRVYSESSQDDRQSKKIELYATDYTVPCEVEMTSVVGTQDGRIFMCGAQDGNFYELHYQGSESWFSKPSQIINHSVGGMSTLLPRFTSSRNDDRIISVASDISRNCIYTLSINNNIYMYRPSGDKHVQLLQSLNSVYKMAQELAPRSPLFTPNAFQIMSLHVVEDGGSRPGVRLMAITTNGIRVYFGPPLTPTSNRDPLTITPAGSSSLTVVHVRMPPSNLLHPDEQTVMREAPISAYGASQPVLQPTPRPCHITSLENSCYSEGILIASQQGDGDGTDFILCVAPDLTRTGYLGQVNHPTQLQGFTNPFQDTAIHGAAMNSNRPPLTEYATLLSIPGRTWAMAATPSEFPGVSPRLPAPSQINELAKQFQEPPRQLMVLTTLGLTFLMKRRAVDYLRAALEELQAEGNVQPIIEFRDSFGRDQTCAMLLGLASGNTFLDIQEGVLIGNICTIGPELAAVAKQAFYDFGERPMWTERVTYGTMNSQGTAVYSGRREGLALFFARTVRSLWNAKVTTTTNDRTELSCSDSNILTIQKNLFVVKDFLDKNPHLFQSSPSEGGSSRVNVTEQEAWKAEQNSVSELLYLLTRTIEALSFLVLLHDHQFSNIVTQCSPDIQKLISSLTFEDLITAQHGITASRALVNVVIDQQIGQQISVDTISEVLQDRCGSFCSTDDVMLYKAKENIRKSVETKNLNEKQNLLAESLRLFVKGARILEFEKLREICGDFQQLNYAKGAVVLPLTCAQVSDPDNIGVEAWHGNVPPSDLRSDLVAGRLHCYELVLDSLLYFEGKCTTKPPSAAIGGLDLDDPETVRSHAYELAFASEDEMFHSTLYDWLINRNMADDLLETRPAFLEAHLRRDPVTVKKYQLLWQFYVKNGQPLRAAEILGALAESDQFDLHIDSRLEYLTLAVANAKSHPISVGGRHETAIAFLTDLEEKLDVAQVQLEIYNVLLPHVDDAPEVREKVRVLSQKLLIMTELYQGYAVAFDLPDIMLLCLHVSEHRDESVVRPIWNQIFDEIVGDELDPGSQAEAIQSRVIRLGRRFYPSESAFPIRFIAGLVVRFKLANKSAVSPGWVARMLIQSGLPYSEAWDVFHEMYESQVPPFNDQENVQTVSSEIAVLLSDWLDEATRPQTTVGKGEFPVGRIDITIDEYLAELEPSRIETKEMYENVKRQLRRHW